MFTVPKKLSLRLSSGWLSPEVGTPWVSQLRADHLHVPCGFPDSALAHLRGVGGSELAQAGSWLSPSAPAQGSRWSTRDTDIGISLGAVFVHGWAPFHNRGCGIKDKEILSPVSCQKQ